MMSIKIQILIIKITTLTLTLLLVNLFKVSTPIINLLSGNNLALPRNNGSPVTQTIYSLLVKPAFFNTLLFGEN